MEFGRYNIQGTLKNLAERHNYSAIEKNCTLKLMMYLDKTKEYKSTKKIESNLNEILKMYLLELCFRRKFFGILRHQKNVFIEKDIIELPEEFNNANDFNIVVDFLQEKDNPIRKKMSFSKTYLPHEILQLLH